jgi:hypothetical protein
MPGVSDAIKADFWRPEERKTVVRRRFGWGWTVNFAEVARRIRRQQL